MNTQKEPSTKVKQKREIQKQEILTCASNLFAIHGYHGTTLESIATEMGMTRAALYRYFSSKDEILYQCNEIAYEKNIKTLEELKSVKSSAKRLEKMVEAHILLYLQDFPTFRPILFSIKPFPDEYKEKIIAYRKKVENIYLTCIEEWRKESPNQLKDIDNRLLLNIILGSVNAVPRWSKGEGNADILARQVTSIIMYGIYSK